MDRNWKRIIPPTEDSDSCSSGDADIDINDLNQQWLSISKRARLRAQANMRGENLPLDSTGDSESVQNALENVLLHHDYAEQSQRRNSSSLRTHNSALSPINNLNSIRMFSSENDIEDRTSGQFHNIFRPPNMNSPVQRRSAYDLFELGSPPPTLQSINNSAPNSSNVRLRFSLANPDQGISSTVTTTANNTSSASYSTDGVLPSAAATSSNIRSPTRKRHLDVLKQMDFMVAMRRYKFRPLSLPSENGHDEAGPSSSIFEPTRLSPSGSASLNTSPIMDVDVSPPKTPLNNSTILPVESNTLHRPEPGVNECNPEIIQVPPVERLESAEAVDSINTITVSTSEVLSGSITAQNVQLTGRDNTINDLENSQSREISEENLNNLANTENANDINLENPSPEISQIQIQNREGNDTNTLNLGLLNDLNQGLLNILECPVCWEFISPPIHQCKRGHLLCLSCMQRLHSCPTCRARFTNLRNLAMEKVAGRLYYPCKNSQSGCNETMCLVDKSEHEANCMHRVYRCIVSVCPWNGKHPDLLNHMTNKHREIVVSGDHKYLYISLDNNAASENWILLAHDVIFRVNFAINSSLGKIHGCVQYVGPRRLANNYSYTFKAESTAGDMKRSVEYTRTTHNDQDKLSAIYNAGDAFMLMRNTATFFCSCSDRHMLVKVTIKKISEA